MAEIEFENSKLAVQKLVEKYNQVVANGRIKEYKEENTKKDFITPLFRVLGWDMENDESPDEVTNEDQISKGRVDYAFRLNAIPKFYLEAKALNKGLDERKDASQAISYAWYKSTNWAVLTDFKTLIVYNAEVKNITEAEFIRFDCGNYINQFQKLWWLSKSAFQDGLLDKEATDWGKKRRKTKVGEQLLSELMGYRQLLSKNIVKNNTGKNLSEAELDEAVQKIIDRLIFIRTTEDREIDPKNLLSMAREFEAGKKGKLRDNLSTLYRIYDRNYNSKLFTFDPNNTDSRHLCETLEIDNETLVEVINGLYKSKDGMKEYDFSAIDADVLGNIYEQYLGHILRKTDKRAKVEMKEAHRHAQGIYYTPTYVVDYIVRNTLGEMLKNKKPEEVDKIRVLDMACGSGSFLLKTFDVLNEYYKAEDKNYHQTNLDTETEAAKITRKTKILKNNIYGVDLDPKAVEIAQLNLLLKAAETKHRLPDLRENIKCGNSLISQSLTEETRAFEWHTEFHQIVDVEKGFDVVIGNPPYIRIQTAKPEEKNYFGNNYVSAQGKFDLYILFIEKALTLLKEGGYFSFIVPNKFTQTKYGGELKKFILNNFTIVRFIDFGDLKVFGDVTTYPCIIVIKKTKPIRQARGTYIKIKMLTNDIHHRINMRQNSKEYEDDFLKVIEFDQKDLSNLDVWTFMSQSTQSVFDKINNSSNSKLKGLTEKCVQGFITGNNTVYVLKNPKLSDFEVNILKKMPKGKNIRKFGITDEKYYAIYPQESDGEPITEKKLGSLYPKTYAYLKANETELKKRRYFNKTIMELSGTWWGLVHPISLEYFEQNKIITPNLSRGNRFTLDTDGFFVEHDCYIVILKNKDLENYLYVLGILNSSVIEFFIKQKSPMFSGGYYKYHTQYIDAVPIIEPTPEIKKKIISLVQKSILLNKSFNNYIGKMSDEATRLEKDINETNKEIDLLVYSLYSLTNDEIKIVEGAIQ